MKVTIELTASLSPFRARRRMARRASARAGTQPPDAIDRVRRVRALGGVNPETGAHYRGLAETAAVLRANGWDVEAADRAMRGAP